MKTAAVLHCWLVLLLLLGTVAFAPLRPIAQAAVQIEDVAAFYTFAEQINFQARISPVDIVVTTYLFIQPAGEPVRMEPVVLGSDGALIYSYDLTQSRINSFTTIKYWFRFQLKSGAEVISDTYSFDYIDNRFEWQTLTDQQFRIHWYDRDLSFGQDSLNAAQAGITSAQSILPASPAFPIDIYIYNNTRDYQSAKPSDQDWAAGHASPTLNLILVTIPSGPEEQLELQRQLPHELAHILQYTLTGENYNRIPVWFLEGSASLAEIYPNPDYESVLQKSAKTGTLLPLEQLCGSFPREASGAFLAYAQSTSFTRFLLTQFGSSGLAELMSNYQDGVGCLEAPQQAFGQSFATLENRWRQEELGVDVGALVFRNLSPYLVLLALILAVPLAVTLWIRAK